MKNFLLLLLFGFGLIVSGCASTVSESGATFNYHENLAIIPNKSVKSDLISVYGQPTGTKIMGKYQVIRYYYSRESMKHGRAIGEGLLSGVTMGLSDLAVDHGVKNSDMQLEYKEILAYVDLQSGIIKDYYYHDSDLKGHDESESLYLQANALRRKGGKSEEVTKLLEKSISLNPSSTTFL